MGKNAVNGYGPPPKKPTPHSYSRRGGIKKELELLQGVPGDPPTLKRIMRLRRMLAKKR